MIALGNALSLSLFSFLRENLLDSCRKRNGIPRNFALQSNSYRAARETLVFHACRRYARLLLLFLSHPPWWDLNFVSRELIQIHWRKRSFRFDRASFLSFDINGDNEIIWNAMKALDGEVKTRRIPFLRSPRSSLWNPVRRPGRVLINLFSCISYEDPPESETRIKRSERFLKDVVEGEGPITHNFVSRVIGGEARRGERKRIRRCLSRESRRCTGRSLTPRD